MGMYSCLSAVTAILHCHDSLFSTTLLTYSNCVSSKLIEQCKNRSSPNVIANGSPVSIQVGGGPHLASAPCLHSIGTTSPTLNGCKPIPDTVDIVHTSSDASSATSIATALIFPSFFPPFFHTCTLQKYAFSLSHPSTSPHTSHLPASLPLRAGERSAESCVPPLSSPTSYLLPPTSLPSFFLPHPVQLCAAAAVCMQVPRLTSVQACTAMVEAGGRAGGSCAAVCVRECEMRRGKWKGQGWG
uniref:Uncharacterized protein n=1 Tax=Palpitomonas bilix TaxID=652834 RepID=A0A7S3DDX7_9EUKA|mmetsp:Transcript_33745/g.86529  ORF Transcript_33745/g.86529 Transcript_33745/m.86529 type:complete len:243 (+) Transcript_33745:495-1223(+)